MELLSHTTRKSLRPYVKEPKIQREKHFFDRAEIPSTTTSEAQHPWVKASEGWYLFYFKKYVLTISLVLSIIVVFKLIFVT